MNQNTGDTLPQEALEEAHRSPGNVPGPPRKIVKLSAENVKRIQAVEIEPGGNLVVIGGKNAAGKTSVLDAIMYALAGTRSIPTHPIRAGADSGKITLNLSGDPPLTVTRRLSPSGGSLEIRNAEGFKASSPQKILDELCGRIAFDPLAFSRMDARKQADTLRELVGLDFAAIDAERKLAFDERTVCNRRAKEKEAAAAQIVVPDGTPEKEVSVAALVEKLKGQRAENAAIERARRRVEEKKHAEVIHRRQVAEIEQAVATFKAQLTRALEDQEKEQAALAEAVKQRAQAEAAVAELVPIDTAATEREITEADAVNRAVRQKDGKAELAAEAVKAQVEADAYTEKIRALDAHKGAALAAAEWPVDGLGFDENGVTLHGLPFDHASSAEQLRVSVAMGLALNPTLRVLLIRDGSLLDADSLRMVAEMAADHDGQVWLETVSVGEQCSVIIHDGHVATPSEVDALRGEA